MIKEIWKECQHCLQIHENLATWECVWWADLTPYIRTVCKLQISSFLSFWKTYHPNYFKNNFYLLIYFCLDWVFSAARMLFSSCGEQGLLSRCSAWASLVASLVMEHRLQGAQPSVLAASGLSGCSSQALEHRISSCSEWVYHVLIRDRAHISYVGRQILYHWATREAPAFSLSSETN